MNTELTHTQQEFQTVLKETTCSSVEQTHQALVEVGEEGVRNIAYSCIARGMLYLKEEGTQKQIATKFNVGDSTVSDYMAMAKNKDALLAKIDSIGGGSNELSVNDLKRFTKQIRNPEPKTKTTTTTTETKTEPDAIEAEVDDVTNASLGSQVAEPEPEPEPEVEVEHKTVMITQVKLDEYLAAKVENKALRDEVASLNAEIAFLRGENAPDHGDDMQVMKETIKTFIAGYDNTEAAAVALGISKAKLANSQNATTDNKRGQREAVHQLIKGMNK